MTDYTELDAAILERLADGPLPFHALMARKVSEIANRLAKPDSHGVTTGWRVLDRRLQTLRKAGKITHDRKTGWRLA